LFTVAIATALSDNFSMVNGGNLKNQMQ